MYNEIERLRKQIADYEQERDFNLSIHCPLVAAKFQRYINALERQIKILKGNNGKP